MPAYNIPLEYLKCRRRIYNAAPATNYGVIGTGFVISATKVRVFINLPISQAKSPSIVYKGTFEVWTEKGVVTPTKIEVNNGVRGKLEIAVDITIPTPSGLANGDYVVLRNKNVTTNIFMIDAYDY